MPRLALLVAVTLLATGPARAVDLLGTWHVTMHYKDSASGHPERERWQDVVWVFSEKGSRLEWTVYPIVVFGDQSGRFERLGGNRASRVLAWWEPNEAQLAEIRSGLQVNSRGSQSKSLRRRGEWGWSSASSSAGGYQSARFITFSQTWSISGEPGLPVFQRDDVLGSAAAEQLEGRTRWATETVDPDGTLRGRYDRDGTRTGSFAMRRSGGTQAVRGSGKTQRERVYEAFFGEMGQQLLHREVEGGVEEAELRRMIEAGEVPDEVRQQVRARIREDLEEFYRSQGNDPRAHEAEIRQLAADIEHLYLDEGLSTQEIRDRIATGALQR